MASVTVPETRMPWCVLLVVGILLLLPHENIVDAQTYELQGSGELDSETYLLAYLPNRLQSLSSVATKEPDNVQLVLPSVVLKNTTTSFMQEYTVCATFSVYSQQNFGTVVNYFTEPLDDVISISVFKLAVVICEGGKCNEIIAQIYPDEWYQLCVVASHTTFLIYQHGVFVTSIPRKEKNIPLGGIMVVGQDQDIPGGDFSLGQAFRGLVANVGMWARQLASEDIQYVAKCDAVQPTGNLLPWGSSVWQVHGRAHIVNVSHCRHATKRFFPFWELLKIDVIKERLKIFGMVLAVPQSHEEVVYMANLLDSTPPQCTDKFKNKNYAFIDVFYDNTTGMLINMNNNATLNHSSETLFETYILKSGMIIVTNKGKFEIGYRKRGCFFGEYMEKNSIFHLRGLCEVTTEDDEYAEFVLSTNSHESLYFAGLNGGAIVQEGSMWYVMHRYRKVRLASTQSTNLPIGRQKWTIEKLDSLCTFQKGYRSLVLSICSNDEFTCTDGSCVLLSSRCDLVPDCEDWSDEHFCETVSLPDGYLPNLPPPPPIGFLLNISFSHLELDLKTMTFTMKLSIQLEWYDGRISFLNLREGTFVNTLAMDGEQSKVVWMPKLQLSDMTDQGSFSNPTVYVRRQSRGYLSQDDVEYPGKDNALIFIDMVMPRFKCLLNLRMYPWDSQICQVTITVTNVKPENGHFVNYTGQYLGREDLQEYLFEKWWLTASGNTAELSFQVIRLYEKHVWTTIVPTSLLLGISYGTLFIPVESFSERGTMSLTTLLVLVSLYTETLSSLPVTSYNKKIEKWYILLIIYVSLIITLHLALSNTSSQNQNFSAKDERLVAKSGKVFWKRQRRAWPSMPCAQTVLLGARIVFGFALVVTVCLFFVDVI